MSVFPFITPPADSPAAANSLPLFKEYAYDFANNCLLLKDGQTYLVYGNEALRIWIFKALSCERFRYTAYDAAFGSEIDTLPGLALNQAVLQAEIKRFITEALMVNPYIVKLDNFKFERSLSGLKVDFEVKTIYGVEPFKWQYGGVAV